MWGFENPINQPAMNFKCDKAICKYYLTRCHSRVLTWNLIMVSQIQQIIYAPKQMFILTSAMTSWSLLKLMKNKPKCIWNVGSFLIIMNIKIYTIWMKGNYSIPHKNFNFHTRLVKMDRSHSPTMHLGLFYHITHWGSQIGKILEIWVYTDLNCLIQEVLLTSLVY